MSELQGRGSWQRSSANELLYEVRGRRTGQSQSQSQGSRRARVAEARGDREAGGKSFSAASVLRRFFPVLETLGSEVLPAVYLSGEPRKVVLEEARGHGRAA